MPETTTQETPGEKTMRRFYEGDLARRLIQTASMEKNRELLRRGSKKMQDGTLGQSDPNVTEDDPMNITIGDQYHVAAPQQTETPAVGFIANTATEVATGSNLKTALLSAALLASGCGLGAGIPWLLGAFDKSAPVSQSADTNTQYEFSITPESE